MKEFILEENEDIIANFTNVAIKANNTNFQLNVILTNNRIVLLKDIDSNLEVVLNIPFNVVKELKYIGNINKITFKDNNNEIDIKCEDFRSFRIQI